MPSLPRPTVPSFTRRTAAFTLAALLLAASAPLHAGDLNAEVNDMFNKPLLNFEWVMHDSGCRAVGVKGGRSPA